MGAEPLVEVWRGDVLESLHLGHAVVCGPDGRAREAWGDPDAVILPRSSCKMIQALPLVESGAALPVERLALACASHEAARAHLDGVASWLSDLGLTEADLRCGAQPPRDPEVREALRREGGRAGQIHNNCSGKHAGFLQLAQRLGGGPDYVEADHPVQRAVRGAFEEVTGEASPDWVVDGCSAPNFACTLTGLATAMARFAAATGGDARGRAMVALREAMVARPDLVAGEGRACTALMRAMDGVAVKTGAEGVFVAILPCQGLGVALKVSDGATRASECAVAAILARLGVLDPALVETPVVNWRGITTGVVRPSAGVWGPAGPQS